MNDPEWQQAYNAGRREASEGLVEALESIINLDTDPIGECSKCGDRFGGVLMCDCKYSSWKPVSPESIARTALAKYREGL